MLKTITWFLSGFGFSYKLWFFDSLFIKNSNGCELFSVYSHVKPLTIENYVFTTVYVGSCCKIIIQSMFIILFKNNKFMWFLFFYIYIIKWLKYQHYTLCLQKKNQHYKFIFQHVPINLRCLEKDMFLFSNLVTI